MQSLSVKKHYLVNSFTGFQNCYNTKIVSIEVEGNNLVLDIRVNPTCNDILLSERVYTTVTYNLVKDTFTIKCEGKGSKKYNHTIKSDITGIIESLVSYANKIYKTDCSDSLSLTTNYYCNQLKEAGATVAQSNQMYFDINHTFTTIQEMQTAFNTMMDELTADNTGLTTNEKEVISTRLSLKTTDLNNTIFAADELKNATIIRLINEHAENKVNALLLEKENINITNKPLLQWTEKEHNNYSFYIHNIKVNILDGTDLQTVENVRNEYKHIKAEKDHHILVEKSFELPDHEVPLNIFIERSSRAENILKAEHENIIKNAINEGLEVPAEVMKDYSYLLENNSIPENNNCYIVGSRNFTTYSAALQYCNDCDFDPETMIQIEGAGTSQPLSDSTITDNSNNTIDSQPELFYLYKNTFNTYNEAYNHAITNMIPITMIISNKHPYMTNERLQELEKEYVFSKGNMSITDIKEYYNYISELPVTLDQENRYYKLKSYIQRHEYKQQQREQREREQKKKALQIDKMLMDLYSIGMTKKEYSSLLIYYLNNEKIYSWSSGISTEKCTRNY